MRSSISLLLLPILLLIGCMAEPTGSNSSPTAAPDAAQLQTNSWLLLELNGQPPVPGTKITLNFDGEAIGGSSGCNVYGGSYELVDGRLTISDIFSTMMACLEDGVMEQEAAFHQALRDAISFAISADRQTLELQNADGDVLARLTAADEIDETEIAGPAAKLQKQWRLVELNRQATIAGSEVTFTFYGDSLGGNAGCNGYGSPYSAADGRLTISQLVYHEVLCMADGIMEQEEAYLTALGAVVFFELSDNGQTLWLRDAEGHVALRFTSGDAAGDGL